MATLPEDKVQANFALSKEVRDMLGEARTMHRRIDGSGPTRVSEYVEDLLRRDLMAKGLIAPPKIEVLAKPKRSVGLKKQPKKKK